VGQDSRRLVSISPRFDRPHSGARARRQRTEARAAENPRRHARRATIRLSVPTAPTRRDRSRGKRAGRDARDVRRKGAFEAGDVAMHRRCGEHTQKTCLEASTSCRPFLGRGLPEHHDFLTSETSPNVQRSLTSKKGVSKGPRLRSRSASRLPCSAASHRAALFADQARRPQSHPA